MWLGSWAQPLANPYHLSRYTRTQEKDVNPPKPLDPRVQHCLDQCQKGFLEDPENTTADWTEMRPRVIRRLNHMFGLGNTK